MKSKKANKCSPSLNWAPLLPTENKSGMRASPCSPPDGYRNNTHASRTTRNTFSQPPPQNLKEWDRQHQDLLGVPAATRPKTGTRNKPEWNSTFAAMRGERWPEWQGGPCLTFAFANWLKKFWHSPDHRLRKQGPPNGQICWRLKIGCTWSLCVVPSTLAHCGPGLPSPLTGDTMVVSMANCAPWKSGNPSATTSRCFWSWAPRGRKSKSLT